MSLKSVLANLDFAALKQGIENGDSDENPVKNSYQSDEEDVLWRIQARLDELAVKDIAYIKGLAAEGIQGLSVIKSEYTPKWFEDCLFSDSIQEQIKELLLETYAMFGPGYTPQFLIDMKNGKMPIDIEENTRITALQAYSKLMPAVEN